MRIIHLILGKARLNRMNGINKVAHNLALHQQEMGWKSEIWGITGSPGRKPTARAYPLRLFQQQRWGFLIDPALKKALEGLNPKTDRVHIHGSFIPAFYRASRILARRAVPYIYCPHGALSPGALERSAAKKRWYFRLFESVILNKAACVQFLGEEQYRAIDSYLDLPQKIIIPNGQNLAELSFEPAPLPLPYGPIFSFCGRLDMDHKGLDLLFEGFDAYVQEGGKGHLWLIGDGMDYQHLVELTKRRQLNHRITFWGSRFGSEKLNLLHHSDVFLHTSRYEGLPTAVLEAAGLGKPCLVSRPTNMGKALENAGAGWLVQPNQPDHILATMLEVEQKWEAGALADMGRNAYELIKEQFNWASLSQQLIHKAYGGEWVNV
ncbi:MAG: glycosyltransferase [Bacteroidota bacterium]